MQHRQPRLRSVSVTMSVNFNAEAQSRGGRRGLASEDINALTGILTDAAIEVHRYHGGPGLLECVYEESLVEELRLRGIEVHTQQSVPVYYKGKRLGSPLRLDILVTNEIIVECKATEKFNSVFKSQLLTYLRATDKRIGLLINFGEQYVSKGIYRVVNGL